MTFIEAILAIDKRPDLELCANENELNGLHPSICVYKRVHPEAPAEEFIGKLR